MNGYERANTVEARGMERLMPFLRERSFEGRSVIRTAKGSLAVELQAHFGDVLMNTSNEETVLGVEIKVGRRFTGNLFLETWSNRNLEFRSSHVERGSKPGWLVTQRADMLLYYFLDGDILIATPLFKLQQWCFGSGDMPGMIYGYPEKPQSQYDQLNDTYGRCVPISAIERDIPVKRLSVSQLELWKP